MKFNIRKNIINDDNNLALKNIKGKTRDSMTKIIQLLPESINNNLTPQDPITSTRNKNRKRQQAT